MYDLSSKFNTFYKKHVVLSKTERNNLFNKKNLNVTRLKEGLKEYNQEYKKEYKLAEEPIVQGSVAMATVTQNESNDYDIDVAIVFDKDNMPLGAQATKNMIVNALKRKCKNFKTEPEAKTNCVRIVYNDGYHIDFAIYRRFRAADGQYQYEHCGSEWRTRDPRSITKWFIDQNKTYDFKLREVVRLLKMFCKSRPESWKNMPGGLILSVLADEKFQMHDRIDERFFYTIKEIRDRLLYDKEVYNPTDGFTSLKLVSSDSQKMTNLYTRLDAKLSCLEVLFEEGCTESKAIEAWENFFKHSYWTDQKEAKQHLQKSALSTISESYFDYKETEEYVENQFPISPYQYKLLLDCIVTNQTGKRVGMLNSMLSKKEVLIPGYNLEFVATPEVPPPYQVYWKVKNQGPVAKQNDCIRGQIFLGGLRHKEPTAFRGNHYVECYIIKNNECVARNRIPVPIKV
ncbi:nucleotidyltransferase [Bacillus infantis]|uniref:nucleotide-binding domain-containing protein n=1 Tax=Bacillus infantis TaxID=324767 RepID=UPI003015DEF5